MMLAPSQCSKDQLFEALFSVMRHQPLYNEQGHTTSTRNILMAYKLAMQHYFNKDMVSRNDMANFDR